MEHVDRAAQLTLAASQLTLPKPIRCPNGTSVAGAVWILTECAEGRVTGSKGHRWLGWGQAILTANHYTTLEQMKQANMRASAEERSFHDLEPQACH